jgi:hypothetical protein
MRLEFIVGGVQKGGTTALHRLMKKHPELRMPRGKETPFFFSEKIDWTAPDYGVLHAVYGPPRPRTRVYGQATPNTIFLSAAHPRIRAYNPEMKFILLFRDPIQRAFSQWKMFRYRKAEPLTFSEAIREGRRRVAEAPVGSQPYRYFSYVERGFYAAQLERLLSCFPREQMLLLRNEELRNQEAATLVRISDFLGIGHDWRPVHERASLSGPDTGERLAPADHAYLREVFADDHRRFVEMTGLGADWMAPLS